MHDYLLSTEWVRFAFVLGIAVSMLLYERRHLTTGSIVVPGYIAVFLMHPMVLAATFLNAFATYALVNLVLRRYVLLYGRAKFTVLAVASTVFQTAMMAVSPSGPWLWEEDIAFFVGAGYIVPALIAHDMARQGLAKTTTSVLLSGAIVAVPIMAVLLLDLPGVNDHSPVRGFGHLAFPVQWLPFAIIVSVVASWAVARNYRCRSGGFVGAAFLGMFMADVWQIAAAITIAVISYLVVTRLLMPHMILFGRRKFSAMLLVSATVAWTALWVGSRVIPPAQLTHIGVGSLALTPLLLPGLLANDAQRTSPGRVLVGASVAAICTVSTTWWAGATFTGQHLALGWKAVAVTTLLALLWPQVRQLTELVVHRVAPGLTVAMHPERVRDLLGEIRSIPAAIGRSFAGRAGSAHYTVVVPVPAAEHGSRGGATTWSSFAEAHPEHAAAAERWIDQMLELGAARAGRREPERPVTVAAEHTVREASRATDLERLALRALTRLITAGRTPIEGPTPPPDQLLRPTPESELLRVPVGTDSVGEPSPESPVVLAEATQ